VSESKSKGKPFDISKWMVKEAYQRVRANKGAAGVDGVTIEQYEQDLQGQCCLVKPVVGLVGA
jgi:RNA-directed DNA polymerase